MKERKENAKDLLRMLDADVKRVNLDWILASEGERFVEVATKFVYKVKGLDMSPYTAIKIGEVS
ncbi:MAG: hydrogenase iron-sulfur subunit [Thermoplasmata archaeon]|nr:MAG: hydrogenase iron-sulfur subunit [Thermoplasmata archaeon]